MDTWSRRATPCPSGVAWVTLSLLPLHYSPILAEVVAVATLEATISSLRAVLDDPDAPHWRWRLRRHLSLVREALGQDPAQEPGRSSDGWLAARSGVNERERRHLLSRIAALGPRVLERVEDDVAADVRRLLTDLEHYQQRAHDLVYDSVALELGGSE